jgi:hypothetical protein
MDSDTPAKTKIAALNEEMDGIHFVNSLYWERGKAVATEDKAAY